MTRAAEANIDLDALQHNLRKVRHAAAGRRIMAVIKADGYGHDILTVARALHDADAFAVDCIDATMTLRSAGVSVLGFMSHFANADDARDDSTRRQLACFNAAVADLPGARSIANSAGLLAWPDSHADWERPGIMLYGVSPFADRTGVELGLRPVMTLRSQLIAVQRRAKGALNGYGGEYRCPDDMTVGVVAIGYGDGYPRSAQTGTPVLVNGARVPLIARVSMDMVCVDLRSQPQAQCGDPVCLWGNGLPVEAIAAGAGTIPYELLCRVTARVTRHWR